MSSVLRTLSYLKKYPTLAGLQFASTVGMTLIIFIFPYCIEKIIDEHVPLGEWKEILWVAAFWAFAYLVQNGLNALRIITNNKFEQKAIFDIRSELYEKIQSLNHINLPKLISR